MTDVRKKSLNDMSAQFNRIYNYVLFCKKEKRTTCLSFSRAIDAFYSARKARGLSLLSERTRKIGTGKFK